MTGEGYRQYRVSSSALTELDEDLPIAHPLVGREGEDAGHIIVFTALLLLRAEERGREVSGEGER